MYNEQEVKIQTRDPDRGNSTPKRQGPCCGLPWLDGRDANAQRPAKDGLKEVIGAWRFRMKVKCRKAYVTDEPACSDNVQSLSVLRAYWQRDRHEVRCIYPVRSVGRRASGSP